MKSIKSKAALFITGLLLTALIACSSDDPAPAPPAPPAAVPPVTLADGVTVRAGSDEAEIVSLSERMITGLRTRDIEAFRAGCHPDLQAEASVAQFAAFIEEDRNYPEYGQEVYTDGFTAELYEFREFAPGHIKVKVDWREGADMIDAEIPAFFEKVDGRWYLNNGVCLLRLRGAGM